jgi:hypothetical protein
VQAALTNAGSRAVLQVRLEAHQDAVELVETLLQTQRFDIPIRVPRPTGTLIDVHIFRGAEVIEVNTALEAWYTGGLRLKPLRKDVGSHLLITLLPDSPRAQEERDRLERRHGRTSTNPAVTPPSGPPKRAPAHLRAPTSPTPAPAHRPAATPRPTPAAARPVAQSPPTSAAPPPAQSPTQRASAVSQPQPAAPGAPVLTPRSTRAVTGQHVGVRRDSALTPDLGAPALRSSATTSSLPVVGATLAFLARVPSDAPVISEGTGGGVEAIRAVEAVSAGGQVVAFVRPIEGDAAATRWILLAERGRVERASVDPEAASAILSLLLQRQGYLDEDQVRTVLQRATDEYLSEEDAIAATEILPASFLLKASRAKLRLLLEKLGLCEEVAWVALGLDTPVFRVLRAEESEVGRFRDLCRALRQRTWNEMEAAHQAYLPFCPHPTAPTEDLVHRFALNDKVARFLDLCATGEQPLRHVYKITGLTRRETFVHLFALRALGYVNFEEPSRDRIFWAKVAETIQKRFPFLVRQSPYEVLELHWTASPFDVSEAVSELEDLLSHATEETVGAELAARAQQLLAYAYSVEEQLATRAGRDAYRAATLDEFQIDQGKKLLASQLEMAVYRRDRELVERLCEVLTELDAAYGKRKWDEAQAEMRHVSGGPVVARSGPSGLRVATPGDCAASTRSSRGPACAA